MQYACNSGGWSICTQGSRAGVTLKYAVEVEIPRSTALMGILDPLLERIVYQDIPTNLSAVKNRVEQLSPGASQSLLIAK